MKLEEKIGSILRESSLKIATAESCTGGLIANRITNISGASEYFEAGFITYSNQAKTVFLAVPEEVITKKGAVSHDVAGLMAEGVRRAAGVDIGLSVTGIAGPAGGTLEKPVGTVYICISCTVGTFVRRFLFDGDREEIKKQTSDAALILVLDYLEGRLI
ncbi:MAG: CinA family protein [Proteobacteria bacterium]|nr:CinA family protein [Pseudomonadota bacterium]